MSERFEIALNTPAGQLTTAVDVPTEFVPISAIVPLARRLGEEAGKLEEQLARNEGKLVSCRMGCAACCRMLVPVSPPEAFALANYLEQLPEERRKVLHQRLAEAKTTLMAKGLWGRLQALGESTQPVNDEALDPLNRDYYALRMPCPFLEQEVCAIYEARPAACRELLVTSPAPLCDDLVNNPVDPLPVSVRIGTVLGLLWAGLTDSPPRLIPLPLALDWARHHEAEGRRTWTGSAVIDQLLDKLWRYVSQEFIHRQEVTGKRR